MVSTKLQKQQKSQYDRQARNTNSKKDLLRTAFEWSVRKLLEGSNMSEGTNLILNSYVDQGTQLFGLHEISITYLCIIYYFGKGFHDESRFVSNLTYSSFCFKILNI